MLLSLPTEDDLKLFLMDKDSAVRICNSVYSILLGFTLHSIFIADKKWENDYFIQFRFLSVLFIFYYLIDWLSYKVLAELDDKHDAKEVILTIIFIIYLGWLAVFSNNILPGNYEMFVWAFLIYIGITAGLTAFYIYAGVDAEGNVNVSKQKALYVDSIVKIVVLIAGIVYCLIYHRKYSSFPPLDTVNLLLCLTVGLLIGIKIWRFTSLSELYQKSEQQKANAAAD